MICLKLYSVRFRDPKYGGDFIFLAKKLDGAIQPPIVLKPRDFDQMNQGNQWKPQIGFTPSNKVASLGSAGHRMIS